jgi:hypothetical protein
MFFFKKIKNAFGLKKAEGGEKLAQAKGCAFCTPSA